MSCLGCKISVGSEVYYFSFFSHCFATVNVVEHLRLQLTHTQKLHCSFTVWQECAWGLSCLLLTWNLLLLSLVCDMIPYIFDCKPRLKKFFFIISCSL